MGKDFWNTSLRIDCILFVLSPRCIIILAAEIGLQLSSIRYDQKISLFSREVFLLQTSRNDDSPSPSCVIMMVAAEEMINQLNQTSWRPGRNETRFSLEWSDVQISPVPACSTCDKIILRPHGRQLLPELIFKAIEDVFPTLKQN